MEDRIDRCFANGHGDAVNLLFFQAGLSGHLLCRCLHAIDAVKRGLKCVGNPASL